MKPGLASLSVELKEAPRFNGSIAVSNHASPGTGSTRTDAVAELKNLSGNGDDLSACAGASKGLKNFSLFYILPVLIFDLDLLMKMERTESTVISKPFSELDITGQSGNHSLEIKRKIYRSSFSEFSLGIMAEELYSKTYIKEKPFSFSAGAVDGESRLTALRISQECIYRKLMAVGAVKTTFSMGIDAFDASMEKNGPDAEFFSLQGQLRYIQRFSFRNSELHASINFQIANDQLLSLEKFTSGGSESVRGYRENYLTSDNGMNASLEFRIPIAGFSLPWLTGITGRGDLSIVPFADGGYGKNSRENETKKDETIWSTGAGLKWDIHKKFTAELFYGYAMTETNDSSEYDFQDDGIHFKLQLQF